MANSEELRELIDRWEDLHENGADPSVEQLCADRPHLAGELRDWIDTLKASDWLREPLEHVPISTVNGHAEETTAPLSPELPVVACKDFLDRLARSGLLSEAEITAISPTSGMESGGELASRLIRENRLTAYQARRLCQGEMKHLVLGEYVILEELGSGGMGQVYRARHRTMNRLVALKTLPPSLSESPELVQRFHREIEAIAKLTHPNIVTAYDAGQSEGVHFLVMELVQGKDMANTVRTEGPLTPESASGCVLQAAHGLRYAHQQGIVHRDIKPSNLLMDDSGTVKILDLGLARFTAPGRNNFADSPDLTGTGNILGTVDYMAPEQAVSTRRVDHRADIYSLGCTLYFLLTGKLLYDGDTPLVRLLAHRETAIPSLRTRRPEVTPELDQVFRKMVAKQAADRFGSMDEVISALEATRSTQPADVTQRRSRPRQTVWTGVFVLLTMLPLVALATIIVKWKTPDEEVTITTENSHLDVTLDGKRLSVASTAVTPSSGLTSPLGGRPSGGNEAQKTASTVDLLHALDLDGVSSKGDWRWDGNTLVSPHQLFAWLEFPKAMPLEYDLKISVRRKTEKGTFGLKTPIGDRYVEVSLDAFDGAVSYVRTVDDRHLDFHNGTLLQVDKEYTVVLRIRADFIGLDVAGKKYLRWKGDPSRLPLAKPEEKGRLAIVAHNGRFEIGQFDMTTAPQFGMANPAETNNSALVVKSECPDAFRQTERAYSQGSEATTVGPSTSDSAIRAAAASILRLGGKITIEGGQRGVTIKDTTHLPKEQFTVLGVELPKHRGLKEEDFGALAPLTGLRHIVLSATSFNGTELRVLQPQKRLGHLQMWDTKLNDEGLAEIARLQSLVMLNIGNNHGFTDTGLRHLTTLRKLEHLELGITNTGDAGLKLLAKLTQLQLISLHHTKITDAGLAHLQALQRLNWLDLRHTSVSDAGLKHLEQIPSLKTLGLEYTRVTEQGVRQLQAELPNCLIGWATPEEK